jgi:hypothetical protein
VTVGIPPPKVKLTKAQTLALDVLYRCGVVRASKRRSSFEPPNVNMIAAAALAEKGLAKCHFPILHYDGVGCRDKYEITDAGCVQIEFHYG